MGGGNTNAAIVGIDESVVEIQALSGTTHLGGEDFDDNLVRFCLRDIQTRFGVDLSTNHKAIARLHNQCEQAKRDLTDAHTAEIECEALINGKDYL
jgi:molecular chaperone DnaK (HSP70)